MPMRDRLARLVHRNPDRPSLRERAAALKASATRVMRRGDQPAPRTEMAPDAGADAELISLGREWLAARAAEQASYDRQEQIAAAAPDFPPGAVEADWREWRETSGIEAEEEEGRRLCGVTEGIAERIVAIGATTVTGLQVKAQLALHYEAIRVDPVQGLPAIIARDLMRLGGTLPLAERTGRSDAAPAPMASDADLIALGRQFDEAHAAWLPTVAPCLAAQDRLRAFEAKAKAAGMSGIEANRAAWLQDGVQEARDREEEASEVLTPIIEAVMAARAHTVAGLAVKARAAVIALWPNGEFEADRALGRGEEWDKRCVRDVVDACVTLARRQAVGGLLSDGPIEKPGDDLPDGMVLYETIDGKLLRRPVAAWVGYMAQRLHSVATREAARQLGQRCYDLDDAARNVLWSDLQRDLRLDALKDLAFRSREVFEAAEAKRREGEPSPAKPELPDLTKLSILQLSNLHDQYEQAADFWSAAAHLPWAGETGVMGCRDMNAAGDILEAESERAGSLRYAVAREIERRVPSADADEQDTRLAALIRDELLCNGGLRHAPALRAAIAEQWSA